MNICVILTILFASLNVFCCSKITEYIYSYVPSALTSFCTRRLNLTGQVGCSSDISGNSGVAVFIDGSNDVLDSINSDVVTPFIIVLGTKEFTNSSLTQYFRSKQNIKGLVVLSSKTEDFDNYAFSESSTCPNGLYSAYKWSEQCGNGTQWNPAGSGYSYISWPFPVVHVADVNNTIKDAIYDCFSKFNVVPVDDTRCSIEISNPMSAVGSSETCFRRQYLMSLHISENTEIFCDELTGLNIVLLATNSSNHSLDYNAMNISTCNRLENSSLFVLTRMDSRSMFERSGFSSQGVLPSIAVLISVAAHLMGQENLKNSGSAKDLFFGFLDNEAYDFMGSYRLSYDLSSGNIGRYTGSPVMWDNVYGIIELGELGLSQKHSDIPTFYMLSDAKTYKQTRNSTDVLFSYLTAASNASRRVSLERPSDLLQALPLPPTAHVMLSDHVGPPILNKHFESFLDTTWPPTDNPTADSNLLDFANTLADALHRIVSSNHSPIPSNITYPKPSDIMHCFSTDPGCDLFKKYLSPEDFQFLKMLRTPVPAQSYLPLGRPEMKVSHLVSILLMGLTGRRTSSPACPPSDERGPYTYWMGYFNGSEQCYFAQMDIMSRFLLMEGEKLKAPAWMRSREYSGRFIRWYRAASPTVDGLSIALGRL
ncbi:unnamed protein product [Heterobilharzia americana]|nr:unnamed protein product [Heterobilharzia americana]